MKKLVVMMLALALLVSGCFALVACNKDGNGEDVVKLIDIKLSDESYGIAINTDKSVLKDSINAALADIDISEIVAKFQVEDLQGLTQYAYDFESAPSSDPSVRANQLVVATNAEFAPFEFKIGDKYAGIDIEIIKAIADALDKEVVLVNMDFDSVLFAVEGSEQPSDAATEGYDNYCEVDIAVAGLTILEERDTVLWSDSYYQTAQVIVTMANDTTFDACETSADVEEVLAGLSGKKAGAQNGTTGELYLKGFGDVFGGFSNITEVGYENVALAAQDLQSGGINFIVTDYEPAKALVNSING